MKTSTLAHVRLPLAIAALALPASAQVPFQFSIDWHGPTLAAPDSTWAVPITEADILAPKTGVPTLGPVGTPQIVIAGGVGIVPVDIGLAFYPPCVGHTPGTNCPIEVDAYSYGDETKVTTAGIKNALLFSTDRFAMGLGLPATPGVNSEGPVNDLSADTLVDLGLGVPPLAPLAAAMPGSVGVIDGNGLMSGSGSQYPGLGLFEPAPGDNLDAILIPYSTTPFNPGIFLSLDSSFIDPTTGFPNSGSAIAHGFVGGDVLRVGAPGGPPALYAPAGLLGLDLLGPDTDDLDALVLAENGTAGYQPSQSFYDWVGGATDMLLFSVRRGSLLIGRPDSLSLTPITEGDVLTRPLAGGLSPYPAIFIAAENLNLATFRVIPGITSDELDALQLAKGPMFDCNGNGVEDAVDIALATSLDVNSNGKPDECEIVGVNFCVCLPVSACGNTYATGGCLNSTGVGAIQVGLGTTSVSADNLLIHTTQIPINKNGLSFMGASTLPATPLFDGVLCVKGPHFRFKPMNSGLNGKMTLGPGIVAYSLANFPPAGWIFSASTWHFQTWYRDPIGDPCNFDSNFSNATSVTFTP